MRLTVLGGCGAYPGPGQACSGYLVEAGGFRLLLDPGYATLPRLLEVVSAAEVDAVAITHGHPDHCSDLNPLLRARALREPPEPALPVFAPDGALDPVLSLDRSGMLASAYRWHRLVDRETVHIGPFRFQTTLLPHFVPNLGFRIETGGKVLAYTGDTGPDARVVTLARDADVFLAEATYADKVPVADAAYLTSARQAADQANAAGAELLMLTHLWPGEDETVAREQAAARFSGSLLIAAPGVAVDL